MAGMIQTLMEQGVETKDLAVKYPGILVGNQPECRRHRIIPHDLAAIVTLMRARQPKAILILGSGPGASERFVIEAVDIPRVAWFCCEGDRGLAENQEAVKYRLIPMERKTGDKEKDLEYFLRHTEEKFDAVMIDPRGMGVSFEDFSKFMEGGKESGKGFKAGAPRNFGNPKLNHRATICIQLLNEDAKNFYYKLRTRYGQTYYKERIGMVTT